MEQIHILPANDIRQIVRAFMNRNKPKQETFIAAIDISDLDTAHGIITHPAYSDLDRPTKDWAWSMIEADLAS